MLSAQILGYMFGIVIGVYLFSVYDNFKFLRIKQNSSKNTNLIYPTEKSGYDKVRNNWQWRIKK